MKVHGGYQSSGEVFGFEKVAVQGIQREGRAENQRSKSAHQFGAKSAPKKRSGSDFVRFTADVELVSLCSEPVRIL